MPIAAILSAVRQLRTTQLAVAVTERDETLKIRARRRIRLDMRGSEWPSKILRIAQNRTFGAGLHRPPQSQETSESASRLWARSLSAHRRVS